MPARIVRPILLIILGLTFGAAAWQIVQLDRDLDVRSTADAATADALTRCRASMLDLRGVQRAYTAPDQDVRFWRTRAAADLEALVACTGTLEATATAAAAPPATQVALAKLRAAVTATRRLDARMADLAGGEDKDPAHFTDRSDAELLELAARYGASYIVLPSKPERALLSVYGNRHYTVYRARPR